MNLIAKHILCVDDDKDCCEMMTALLGLSGCEVASVQNSADAVEMARSDSFDLILLDSWLTDGSGVELCRRIRSFLPHTPVVFYSGAAHESDKQQAMDAGAQAYLVKPTDIEVIEQTILGLLGDGDRVKRDGARLATIPRKLKTESTSPANRVRRRGRRHAVLSRERIELSRKLLKESRERIDVSALLIKQIESKLSNNR